MEKSTIRQSLSLWLTPSPEEDTREQLTKLSNCRIALDLFLEGKLPLVDYLEIINEQGVNIDDYEECVESNLLLLL